VRETAPYFWTNAHVLENPKVRLIVDDGRNYLLRTSDRYDVITLEPPDIFTAGVVNLYTEDFYRIAARALADDGLFCQWIPYAEMSELDARMLVRAFLEVFPHTTLWEEGRRGPLLVVGTKRPLPIDPAVLARRMARDPVHADLVRLGFAAPEALFGFFVAGTERVRAWVADAPSITDDRTVVDFSTPTRLESGFGFGYFRMRGATLKRLSAEQEALFAAFDRLHEPITPFLVRDGPGG
jgi:spermidine synthase